MSGPIAPLDPTTPNISDELWKQSGTPVMSWLIRGWIATVFLIAAWILAGVTGNSAVWALVGVGVLLFFLLPAGVNGLVLARLAAKVDAVVLERNAERGHAVLDELRKNPTVKLLAPHGWLRVQEGRVLLAVGDGRAAARAFGEAERVSTHPDKHELISAQAHALVLAGDRKEARELLVQLRKRDQLSDLDHLNYGVVLLSEAGHNQEALAHLQQARAAFGDHPCTIAGLVLALQRCDKADEAAALLREAEGLVEGSEDQLAHDLLKRAKKGLRPLLKAKQKRERKSDKRVEPSQAKRKGKKGRKQSRRDARKKAKVDGQRSEERVAVAGSEAAGEASESVERENLETSQRDVESSSQQPSADEHDSAREQSGDESSADERLETESPAGESSESSEDEGSEDEDPEGSEDEGSEDDPEDSEDESSEDESSEDEGSEDESSEDEGSEDESSTSGHEAEPESPSEPVLDRSELAPEQSARDPEPAAAASSSSHATPKSKDDEDIDLATLALEALGSGSRRKLDESEGGPSASGLRPIEPSASSSDSLFRSALFDEPKPSADGSSSSLFSLPKFDSMPTFAPPPKPTRGPVLPSRPSESNVSSKPEPKPTEPEAKTTEPEAKTTEPTPKPAKPLVPSVMPPKLGAVPSAPSVPIPKPMPSTPSITAPIPAAPSKPAMPALDDGWGDLGELDPIAAPPTSPAVTSAGKDDSER